MNTDTVRRSTRPWRRTFTIAAALMALSLIAAGCGSSSGKSGGGGTASGNAHAKFTWWTSGETPAQIQTIDTAFDKSHPGMTAVGQYIAKSDDFEPKVISALKTNTQPAVILDQNPSDLPLYAESGKLIDLNGKMTALTNSLYPGIKASLFYQGKQLGMAFAGVGDIALFYNKKDFAKAGIKSPPTTWTELEADAAKLTDPAAHRYGIYIPTGDAEWISFDWEALLWADGGQLLNPQQTKAEFDSSAGVNALTTWVDMVRKSHVAPNTSYAQGGNYDGSPAFASNTVAMLVDGQWDVPTFKSSGLKFGVAPFPAGTVKRSTNLGIGVAALFKATPAQDAAGLAFIKWFAGPKEGAYLAATTGGLPSSATQLSEPQLKKYIATSPGYKVFAGSEKYGQVRPISPNYNKVSEDLWNGINAALSGSQTPAAALAGAQHQANSDLSSSGS